MKKLIHVFASFLLVLLLALVACGGEKAPTDEKHTEGGYVTASDSSAETGDKNNGESETSPDHTEGLVYSLNKDGTSYSVVGLGSATDLDVVIPDSHEGLPVTSIDHYAFCDCDSLTSITISDSVTSIGSSAFSGCSSLTSVTIGDSVTSIGLRAFCDCDSLTSITISDSVTSIGSSAFSGCSSLTSVTIGDSVTSIGLRAFCDCDSLTSITIPDSVTSIRSEAFCDCDSLTSITIPDGVTSIGPEAFSDCDSLTSITIPDSVTSIGEDAFSGCSSLTSITIPDSVTNIGNSAFSSCSNLTNVTIGNGVKSIGYSAFRDCDNLKSITFQGTKAQWDQLGIDFNGTVHCADTPDQPGNPDQPDDLKPTPGLWYKEERGVMVCVGFDLFVSKEDYPHVVIASTYDGMPVTHVGGSWGSFQGCDDLVSVYIPDSVTAIAGTGAFYGCDNLTTVSIGSNVETIIGPAFGKCPNLTTINFRGTMAQWNAIDKDRNWDLNSGSYTVHCTDGDIQKDE